MGVEGGAWGRGVRGRVWRGYEQVCFRRLVCRCAGSDMHVVDALKVLFQNAQVPSRVCSGLLSSSRSANLLPLDRRARGSVEREERRGCRGVDEGAAQRLAVE